MINVHLDRMTDGTKREDDTLFKGLRINHATLGVDPQVYCGERSGSKEERQPAKRRLTVSVALRLLTLHLTKKKKKKKRG